MAYVRKQYKGNVSYTDKLSGGINDTATTFSLIDGSTFPDGSVGPFVVTLDADTGTEEKILCSARSGAAFTVAAGGRGYDNTTATAHLANAPVIHSISAVDLDEANQAVVATLGTVTAAGDVLYASGAHALARLAAGSNGQFLSLSSGIPAWVNSPVTAANIEALFTAAGQIFQGTGTSTGQIVALLSAVEALFTADGQILQGTGSSTGQLVDLLTAIEAKFTASGQIVQGTGSGTGQLITLLSAVAALYSASIVSTSAVGDAVADGTSQHPARGDHVHGREAFYSATPAADSTAGTAGTSANPARGDHAHPDGDTGWTQPALTNSWLQGGQGTYGARQVGKLVMLRGEVYNGTSGTSVFTLAAGMRPAEVLFFSTIDGSGNPAYVEVTDTGLVEISNGLGSSADVHTNGAYLSPCSWWVG